MTTSLTAASVQTELEGTSPAFSQLPTLHEIFATLLDEARQGGASIVDINYNAMTGIVNFHDDGSMAAGPKILGILRDTLAAGTVDYTTVRTDLHRYLISLSCSRRLTVKTQSYTVTLTASPEMTIEKVKPSYAGPSHRGVTLTFDLVQPYPVSTNRLQRTLETLVRGYPLEVIYNGEILNRPFSLGKREFQPFPHGLFLIDDLNLPSSHEVFLNGLPIEKAGNKDTYLPNGFIVHLHPEIFQATAPAKNVLTGGELILSFLRHELHLVTGVY